MEIREEESKAEQVGLLINFKGQQKMERGKKLYR